MFTRSRLYNGLPTTHALLLKIQTFSNKKKFIMSSLTNTFIYQKTPSSVLFEFEINFCFTQSIDQCLQIFYGTTKVKIKLPILHKLINILTSTFQHFNIDK